MSDAEADPTANMHTDHRPVIATVNSPIQNANRTETEPRKRFKLKQEEEHRQEYNRALADKWRGRAIRGETEARSAEALAKDIYEEAERALDYSVLKRKAGEISRGIVDLMEERKRARIA